MVMESVGGPLVETSREKPQPQDGQVLIRIVACGICRTDLHVLDGDLDSPKLPLVPGHEVVGRVESCGPEVAEWKPGDGIGVPWLAKTCGKCKYCKRDQENLCDAAEFHGYTVDGGYAEYMVADPDYCVPLPERMITPESAPLLCAGLIGYRSYRKTHPEHVERLGLYGFGASAHLVAQVALAEGKTLYAFTKEGDEAGQNFAREMGCTWAGASTEIPPEKLDAAIVFAPVGPLMVEALKATNKGGRVVSAGIHMSPIPEFEYKDLWEERSLHSVANLTRKDGRDFFTFVSESGIDTRIATYPLRQANEALQAFREGGVKGVSVLKMAQHQGTTRK